MTSNDRPGSTSDDLVARALGLARPGQRIIIGIGGSPGAGKTTLAKEIVRRINGGTDAGGAHADSGGADPEGADPGSTESGSTDSGSTASASTDSGSTASASTDSGSADSGSTAPGSTAPGRAVYLPMDGFHLANATLDRLGIHDRKGAIETFDGWGFVALLRRILAERDHVVYAPSFERTVDEGIAGEVAVPVEADIVIVEGNYLFVDREPWAQVPGLLAEGWFCETGASERLERLVDRHTRHGRTPEAALAWASTVDGANAILIEGTKSRADLVVSGAAG